MPSMVYIISPSLVQRISPCRNQVPTMRHHPLAPHLLPSWLILEAACYSWEEILC